jgi:hypothetical protein
MSQQKPGESGSITCRSSMHIWSRTDGTLYRPASGPGFYHAITYDALVGHSTRTHDIQTYTTKHHTVSYNTKTTTTKDTPTSRMAKKVPTKNFRAGFSWTNCKTGCQRLRTDQMHFETKDQDMLQNAVVSSQPIDSTEISSKARRIRRQQGCPAFAGEGPHSNEQISRSS